MNTAALYLKNTNASVTETAQSVGYYDTHIFNKTFKNNSVFPLPPGVKNKFGNNLLLGNKKIGMERSPF